MNYEILENGNLKLTPDEDELEEIKEVENIHYDGIYFDVMESLVCNSDIDHIHPEEVGALTGAPILGIVSRDDYTNEITEIYNLWWYPDYAIRGPQEDMLEYGYAIFIKGE